MMATFTIDENAPILVELIPSEGVYTVSLKPEDIAGKSVQALDAAMNTIHHMARRVIAAVDTLDKKPNQVEMAFGLNLKTEGNAWIAKAGAEAAIQIKMVWQK